MATAPEQIIFINFIADINDKTSSLLMFLLTEQQERLESLQKDEIKMAEIIAEKIGKKKDDVLTMFKERKTYSSADAKERGFIEEVEEFVAEPSIPIFTITNQA